MNIGEKVKFLNDVGGGTITKFLNKDTAIVLADDGFEMPVAVNELLVVSDEKKQKSNFAQNKENPTTVAKPVIIEEVEDEEPFYTESSDVNIFLALVPKNDKNPTDSDSEMYLVNDSNYYLTYNYSTRKGEKFNSVIGKIEPNTKEKIQMFPKNSVKEDFEIVLQILFYDNRPHTMHAPVNESVIVRAVKLYKESSYKENDFFDQRAILFPIVEENPMKDALKKLTEKDLDKVVLEKEVLNERLNKPKQFRKRIEPQIREVDLHIDELLDDRSGLENSEMLQVQMDKFRSEMKDAIQNKVAKIVFIHGVGNGVLKQELRKELQSEYKKFTFQDASFKEYGYGATMVIFR
jgi:hypothetical protein